MTHVTIAFVATHWTQTFENFRRSLHVHGYDYDVLGWGLKWQGFRWRTKLYRDYCRGRTGTVIFLDAYDTLARRPAKDFISNYEAFKRPIVIGAEWWCGSKLNCGKVTKWWKDNNTKPAFRCNINAGCVVGRADLLEKVYSWILDNNFDDDQLGFSKWIELNGKQDVSIDSGSTLFYNANVFDGLRPSKSGFFHHFPGPLLKLGIMPLYNNTARSVLGFSARLQYPDTIVETLLFAICAIMLFYVLRHAKPSKLRPR